MSLLDGEFLAGLLSTRPFSFVYGGRPSAERLPSWPQSVEERRLDADQTLAATVWTDPATGLRVRWEVKTFSDFPAVDWLLSFENTGRSDSPILEQINAMDVAVADPMPGRFPYRLHRTFGAPAAPRDYEVCVVDLNPKQCRHTPQILSGGGGRSSNRDFPFYKVEMGGGEMIVAVGWSGQWMSRVDTPDNKTLKLQAGLETCRFRLRPGESARMPRILILCASGPSGESNALFRQLIHKRYCARLDGKPWLPTPFCNTAFTRKGEWLNECNAENQISLIRAYAHLGAEAVITDAGWFEGGWPAGAGNWTPRRDAYPQGMAPVAAAAREAGVRYGLWFEPERVVAGTQLHREHPDWLLPAGPEPQSRYLLNFGLREVQDYFFNIVKGFMDLPGFGFYRQDFNMDPLPHWRFNEAPDRQGMVEIKYIEGLYAWWDRLAAAWPAALREECASGGRRTDIETLMRMHIHQDSDYWFDNDVDQAQTWGLSQYLPNNCVTTPIDRLDDVTFRSVLPTSLCLGWIADGAGFDTARARDLLARYHRVRHLMIGAWYPLLPYSRDPRCWMAMQWHRPDLGEGMVLVFRRGQSPLASARFALRGLDPLTTYDVEFETSGARMTATGADLAQGLLDITLAEQPSSEMILYRPAPAG